MKLLALIVCITVLCAKVSPVKRTDFKTCEQSSFCRRCRKVEHNNSPYELVPGSLNSYSDSVTADIVNNKNGHLFVLKVEGVKSDMFRVTIDEKTPLIPRYRVADALKGPVTPDSIKVTETDSEIIITCGENKVVIHAKPFKIDFYRNGLLVVSSNAKGLFKFEHYRTKPAPQVEEVDADGNKIETPAQGDSDDNDPGSWEEDFNSHHDSKPNGPEAVAMDFTFPQAGVLFGIPEHADSFALKSTLGSEPYRLYNLDVFEYELDSSMALYGSIPVIYGHGTEGTAGVFWHNAAETWVDIYNRNSEKNVISSIVNMVSGDEPLAAHFMSESGIVDFFVLMGPSPLDTFRQYTELTGSAPIPQLYALAYHQCRWNYNDQRDVHDVTEKFDVHDIPMDTMWLDIEYTDGKKYFTWDQMKFPQPLEMINNLTALGRHLTIIIDPHIKRDGSYYVHNDCTDRGYYTKNRDGNDYEGWCWPGSSSYPDLYDATVRKYFADQYLLENFKTTTVEVGFWNDMNEPSVFNGPEVTMPKDVKHNTASGTFEHRTVHNLYAHMQLMSTFDGVARRNQGALRPFILTRGHFSGSQRYAAIWTGDNTADWGHMAVSIKMCLSEAVAGFSFCGADVGGFFGNPEPELFERWYQVGAFQPFFRSHAHLDTRRREPWLMPADTKMVIRDAIRKRYSYLPLFYTLFYEHERFGYPIMRPMLTHYPKDRETFGLDNQYLLGDRLLIRPVLQQGATTVDVYFPRHSVNGDGDLWYDVDNFDLYGTAGHQTVQVHRYKIPIFQRGGTIVPKKERIRRASTLMKYDPYTLVITLDRSKQAKGTLYADDEKSYEYRKGKFIYAEIEFKNNVISSSLIDPNATFDTEEWIERIVVVGLGKIPHSATLSTGSKQTSLTITQHQNENAFVIRKPVMSIADNWEISLNF